MGNFYTDVIKKSGLFHSANRCTSLDLLHPVMVRKVNAIIADAKAHNIHLQIFETYRSKERQLQLYLHGATKLRSIGVHHFGLAADLVFTNPAGGPSWKGNFSFLGHLAKCHGLIWGGDWGFPDQPHSFVDSDHVQWCGLDKQTALFAGLWYPNDNYDPTKP